MVDRHVVKMILETAQLLSTAHRVVDGFEYEDRSKTGRKTKRWRLSDGHLDTTMYSATHINHPSAVWARRSTENYNWLFNHLLALGSEYTYRYGRVHVTIDKLASILSRPPVNLTEHAMTLMPSCMADEYKVGDDPVLNYRSYYNYGKRDLLRWSERKPPSWIDGEVIEQSGKKTIYTIGR